jgi:DNA modification methylase
MSPLAADTSLLHIAEPLRHLAIAVEALTLDPANARKHNDRNLDTIKGSLKRWGQRFPIVVQRQGMVVRAGNGRVMAANALGWTHMAALVVDESEVEAVAFALADNRSSELAEWDDEALTKLLESLPTDLMQVTGFSSDELQELINEICPPEIIEDQVPAPPDQATSRRGDLWVLGQQRLLCGDSGSAGDLDRLLAGAPVHLVHCDPPYNVKVEPRSNNAFVAGETTFHPVPEESPRAGKRVRATTTKLRAKDRPLANDCVSDEAFAGMLDAWFGNIARVLVPGRSFYVWGGYANCGNYPPALKAHGLYFSQALIWVKQWPVLTRKDYMGNHEWCFYGWKEGAGHRFFGPNNVPDTWEVKKVSPQAMVHLTEKPVELAARAIQYSSRPGENVLDLFGGSGSTLMAAEQTKRRAYLMELDPLYCDVILMRWAAATGRQALLDSDGRTYEQVKAERITTTTTTRGPD